MRPVVLERQAGLQVATVQALFPAVAFLHRLGPSAARETRYREKTRVRYSNRNSATDCSAFVRTAEHSGSSFPALVDKLTGQEHLHRTCRPPAPPPGPPCCLRSQSFYHLHPTFSVLRAPLLIHPRPLPPLVTLHLFCDRPGSFATVLGFLFLTSRSVLLLLPSLATLRPLFPCALSRPLPHTTRLYSQLSNSLGSQRIISTEALPGLLGTSCLSPSSPQTKISEQTFLFSHHVTTTA